MYVYSENLKKLLKKKPQRARVKILSMKHHRESVYQVCSNKSPGVKIGPARGRGDHCLSLYVYDKAIKTLLKNPKS
jgi:hypothetical protein